MPGEDAKERFSSRVDDYVRWRPSYPREAIDLLRRAAQLGAESVVADVGAGTGIFSRLLLGTGARVVGVEPNASMRAAAERTLAGEARYASSSGSAEATQLDDGSVALVTAAQAFHWFDAEKARAEFVRILRPGGVVALVWNQRKDTPFNRDYESMLGRFAPDYANVRESDRAAEPKIRAFFAPSIPSFESFEHAQTSTRTASGAASPRRRTPRGLVTRCTSPSCRSSRGSSAPMPAAASSPSPTTASSGMARSLRFPRSLVARSLSPPLSEAPRRGGPRRSPSRRRDRWRPRTFRGPASPGSIRGRWAEPPAT